MKEKKLKRKFFDFKQKKEKRRKGINVSQLAIKNSNDATIKNLDTPCFLFSHGFPWRPKHFKHIFAEKKQKYEKRNKNEKK